MPGEGTGPTDGPGLADEGCGGGWGLIIPPASVLLMGGFIDVFG